MINRGHGDALNKQRNRRRPEGTAQRQTRDAELADAAVIADVIRAREAAVEFFSVANRSEREIWVAREFLENLGVAFEAKELLAVADDPPDVLFREARFEIKEVLDQGRRRHAEFKESLDRAREAKVVEDLFESTEARDITWTDAVNLIRARMPELVEKYDKSTRSSLDILFYVNLENVYGFIPAELPSNQSWSGYGFRSILMVMGKWSGILSVSDRSPSFLLGEGARMVEGSRREDSATAPE